MNKYSEHEKLKKIQAQSQACGEFLDWLQDEKELVLCRRPEGVREEEDEDQLEEYLPAPVSKVLLLAEFFSIDQKKIDEEKEQMLEEQRKLNRGK